MSAMDTVSTAVTPLPQRSPCLDIDLIHKQTNTWEHVEVFVTLLRMSPLADSNTLQDDELSYCPPPHETIVAPTKGIPSVPGASGITGSSVDLDEKSLYVLHLQSLCFLTISLCDGKCIPRSKVFVV